MFNNINLKVTGVHKRNMLLAILLVISMLTMVGCSRQEVQVTTQEFELVSCYIEQRNTTNMFGAVLKTKQYLHFGYVNSDGKVILDHMPFGYQVDFQLTEGTPKVIITTSSIETTYAFQLTREMYNDLNLSHK